MRCPDVVIMVMVVVMMMVMMVRMMMKLIRDVKHFDQLTYFDIIPNMISACSG